MPSHQMERQALVHRYPVLSHPDNQDEDSESWASA